MPSPSSIIYLKEQFTTYIIQTVHNLGTFELHAFSPCVQSPQT